MTFGKKRKNKKRENLVEVKKVMVATARITSSYDVNSSKGPVCLTIYFLVYEEEGVYFELFSNRKMKKEINEDEVSFEKINVPCIEEVRPLTQYLKDVKSKFVDKRLLFDFITNVNVKKQVETLSKNN